MCNLIITSVILIGVVFDTHGQHRSQDARKPDIEYQISIQPRLDRTDLAVTMLFKGDATGETRVELPRCRFGTPDIWSSISRLIAGEAEIERLRDEPWVCILTHKPNVDIELKYTLSRSRDIDTDLAYRPDVSPSHFHFFGSQWRARVANRTAIQSFRFEFRNVPAGWRVFSNLGDGGGPWLVEARDNELSGFIAGGKFEHSTFDVKGTPVSVYVLESMNDPQRIVKSTREVIQIQGEIFGEFKGDFFLVSVIPRSGIRAGTAIDNAFICLTDAETDPVDLDVLLAHEVFHKWLPHTGTIDCWHNGSDVDEFRLDWFVEGFTEYVARRVLLDSNRISVDDYVNRFNQDLKEQATNPMHRASLATVKDALKNRSFTNRHERTSYFRGPLIGLKWEHQLAKTGKRKLVDIVSEFVSQAAANGGELDEQTFFDFLENYGIDARGDYRRHIVFGDPPMPPADVFEQWGYYFVPKQFQPLDHGFNVLSSRTAGMADGVILDGAAYQAGLRDGMIIEEILLAKSQGDSTRLVVREYAGEPDKEVIEFIPAVVNVDSGWFRFEERD